MWKQWQTIFLGSKITVDGDWSHKIKKHFLLGRKVMTNLDSILKAETSLCQQRSVWSNLWFFPVVMHRCESWTTKKTEHQKNWCFQIVVLEKTLESPLDSKETKQVNPKGNQPWIFIGRTDAEAPILWPPDVKTHWKRPWWWERLKAGEGGNRGDDGWMTSPNQWTWVWANSSK